MTRDFELTATPVRSWTVGGNGEHRAHEFEFQDSPAHLQRLVLVDGYNLTSDNPAIAALADEYPGVPIVFRSQIGAHPHRDPDGAGGWRIRWPDTGAAALEVPFRFLSEQGIVLR